MHLAKRNNYQRTIVKIGTQEKTAVNSRERRRKMIHWHEIDTPFGSTAKIAFIDGDSVRVLVRREDMPLFINGIRCIGHASYRLGSAGGVSMNDDTHWRLDTNCTWFRRAELVKDNSITDNMRAKLWKWLREEVPLWIHANKKIGAVEAELTNLQDDAKRLDERIENLIEERKLLIASIQSAIRRLKKAKGE